MVFILITLLIAFPALGQNTMAEVPGNHPQIHLSFAPIVERVSPAVVNIYAARRVQQRAASPFFNDPFFNQFFGNQMQFGMPRERIENSLGSGVIVDKTGLVITNAHVIKGAETATIALNDGREFEADILIIDEPSDLALIQAKTEGTQLPYAKLQSSENLRIGDLVIAIGNPFGVGQTVTSGIVSALARSTLDINDFNFFIQTDAAINPGNSGGPLVDLNGNVIGINTAIFSRSGGSLGIGFAIPSEMVATLLAAHKSGKRDRNGRIQRAWFGIDVQTVDADIARSLGLTKPQGALVSSLHPASPAQKAGLKQGDIIIAAAGRPLRDAAELTFRFATVAIGRSIALDILRDEKPFTLDIEAVEAPDTPARQATSIKGKSPLTGLVLCRINPALQVELGLSEKAGITVCGQEKQNRFFTEGDIIVSINDQSFSTPRKLASFLDMPARGWKILFRRNGRTRTLLIR